MKPEQEAVTAFYQNLGKLFYAIAAADKVINDLEIKALKKSIASHWVNNTALEPMFNTDAVNHIALTFDWLHKDEEYDAQTCFSEFIRFKNKHESLFSKPIKQGIIKTAGHIAASFSQKNKSELIMLAKLDLELKKTAL